MIDTSIPSVAIIGGGPAGLMAAEVLSEAAGIAVTVYDAMPTMGRKFLMAGRGGLNLTHSEPLDDFLNNYQERRTNLAPLIACRTPDEVRAWCEGLGQPTFIGTSGRVFPKDMKASGLLRAWLSRLTDRGVRLRTRHRWMGWAEDGSIALQSPDGLSFITPSATILALGGASWPRLGSDGQWHDILVEKGIEVAALRSANCGFEVPWSNVFISRFEGMPLKGIALTHGETRVRGEAIISRYGLEGGAVYALSAGLRDTIAASGTARLEIDLRPDMDRSELMTRLTKARGKQSLSNFLRKAAKLSPAAIGLLQEAARPTNAPLTERGPDSLARAIKSVELSLTAPSGLEKAISTAGGITFQDLDEHLMLKRMLGVFAAGEMLDWEAPTGGYLLQGCFSTGAAAGRGVLAWLGRN